ncbi:DUF2478 domain-containing protein [Bradyrhizobium erythrophlei]|uniref:DUF2478 domain-containing protein n=1 Tax=Bradyrhizobium erythrophlei TaxID=1437360 RepID=UPI0035EEA097
MLGRQAQRGKTSNKRITGMITNLDEIDPNLVAALFYGPEDDVDTLLADFAQNLARQGARVGGIIQRDLKNANGTTTMLALDVATGHEISICQPLGSGSTSCRLDTHGLADAAAVVTRAINENVDLLVINKFSKQEASGQGLRAEFATAITRGVPLLTAVPKKCLADWRTFTGDVGTLLLCERQVVEGWWRAIAGRMAHRRSFNPRVGHLGTIIPDSLITAERVSPTLKPGSSIGLIRRKRP